jgi:sugar phosphate isomerase/epimerase
MLTENHPIDASISSMWALQNFPDLNDFFAVAKQLGFQKIELNHQIDSAMLSKVIFDHYQFSSVHEPCPADISTKELVERDWLISSPEEVSRLQGVDSVKKSIDLAYRLGAPTIVIHCGTIPYETNYESNLRSLFKDGKIHSVEYQEVKSLLVETRKGLVHPRIQAVRRSLNELFEYSDKFKVKLGLENNYHYMDIHPLMRWKSCWFGGFNVWFLSMMSVMLRPPPSRILPPQVDLPLCIQDVCAPICMTWLG